MSRRPPTGWAVLDGNEAAASVAYRASEVLAIYPITPSSTMGELADAWSAEGRPNLWGTVPEVVEMQSEGGAAGAVHGALQAGALATTFTASQGLLLMIPNMYKIAGELTAFVMHVAARSLATHALSIFGDHSDVMACRQTGFAMLASGSVQEAHDLAAVAHAATLRARIPFLHFFDGFRTSHELVKVQVLSDDTLRSMLSDDLLLAHRRRALTPDRPVLRGTAHNPDTFFQAREASNRHYLALPSLVQETMDALARRSGRPYRLFDYVGHPDAERVLVLMGSGAEAVHEVVLRLAQSGERVGLVKVRLYRPFSAPDFLRALPPTTRAVAVLDRTKEPGSLGEPLFLDVVAALHEGGEGGRLSAPTVIGGRYGLASKEFDPPMIKAVFDELRSPAPRRRFTVGITDDVTHLSLRPDADFRLDETGRVRAVFYGLGSDGTVSANKNSIKVLGQDEGIHPQGYFVYDSKKSGSVTTSHLRFGPEPIRSTYLVDQADFVACHQFPFLFRFDVLDRAAPGAVFLLNAPYGPDEVWDRLPREVQQRIVDLRLRLHVVDAGRVARECGLGSRINTIMQICFFALSGVLPREVALARIKAAVEKTYGSRGTEVVRRNFAAIDAALEHLHEVDVPACATASAHVRPPVAAQAPDFVQRVTAAMLAGRGDLLPVSAFPPDGTWPLGTSRYERRSIAPTIPVWDEDLCIQCNKCTLQCPHATIRAKAYPHAAGAGAPPGFRTAAFRSNEHEGWDYTLQVAPEDCTGCGICVEVCPAKDKGNPRRKALAMQPQEPQLPAGRAHWDFFLGLPEVDRATLRLDVKGSQFLTPLFEFSGACSGCGETPYLKLLTQLFGDRLLIANATGCSSIYGGNLPTTPYTTDQDGRGPAWSNSLFEDNAEFGLGMRLGLDSHARQARALLEELAGEVGGEEVRAILSADQSTEAGIQAQRVRVSGLRARLEAIGSPQATRLAELTDHLVDKSVWIVGGDGWAYDIGFGGLDHVLHSGRNVNVLVLDTEVYSNTGGQQSKSTPTGAVAKFAALGRSLPKKDLVRFAMGIGHVYVAQVALGARDAHTVRAFLEAEAYPGPSLILAYSPCIAHGYDLAHGPDQQRLAVETGVWPLLRYDPRRSRQGLPPLQLDSADPKGTPATFMANEARFRMLEKSNPARWRALGDSARRQASERWAVLQQLARVRVDETTAVTE